MINLVRPYIVRITRNKSVDPLQLQAVAVAVKVCPRITHTQYDSRLTVHKAQASLRSWNLLRRPLSPHRLPPSLRICIRWDQCQRSFAPVAGVTRQKCCTVKAGRNPYLVAYDLVGRCGQADMVHVVPAARPSRVRSGESASCGVL